MAKLTNSQLAINQRVYQVYLHLNKQGRGINKGEFCESVGLEPTNFSKYFRDDEKAMQITTDAVANVSRIYRVSLEWLMLGVGQMVQETAPGNYVNTENFEGSGNQLGIGTLIMETTKEVEMLRIQLEACRKELSRADQLIAVLQKSKP